MRYNNIILLYYCSPFSSSIDANTLLRESGKHLFACLLLILSAIYTMLGHISMTTAICWFGTGECSILQSHHENRSGERWPHHPRHVTITVRRANLSETAILLLFAAYFYFGCTHVKPMYYFGSPSMYKTIWYTESQTFRPRQLLR